MFYLTSSQPYRTRKIPMLIGALYRFFSLFVFFFLSIHSFIYSCIMHASQLGSNKTLSFYMLDLPPGYGLL